MHSVLGSVLSVFITSVSLRLGHLPSRVHTAMASFPGLPCSCSLNVCLHDFRAIHQHGTPEFADVVQVSQLDTCLPALSATYSPRSPLSFFLLTILGDPLCDLSWHSMLFLEYNKK